MPIDKNKILAAIVKHDAALRQLEDLRRETRSRLKDIAKGLNAIYREVARQDDAHEAPTGFLASDPDGDLLVDLRENFAPSYDSDEVMALADRDAWRSHLSLDDHRDQITALSKRLANR